MKRIGKVLLSSVLLFSGVNTAVWAEEELEKPTETEEVTEITEEESEETVEEEVITEEETVAEEETPAEEEAPAEEAAPVEEETVAEEEESAPAEEQADLLDAAKVDFVSNLYTNILNRPGSSAEISGWVNGLNGQMTAARVIAGFVESSEYQSKYPGDRAYVEDMYEVILSRTGSASEVNGWVSCMESGQTYRAVLAGMINSSEFKRLCEARGMTAGSYTSPKAVDKNLKVTKFVSRLYTKALGRKYDVNGLENWAGKILSGMTGARLTENFIESKEYKNKNLSTAAFVTNLYEVLLDRTPGSSEVNYWIEKVNGGQTRRAIAMGLVNSTEFNNLCQASGINRGVYASPNAVDQNYAITTYVGRLYEKCLGRKADAAGLESWTARILNGTNTAAGTANGFFNSAEMIGRKLSNSAYVRAAYQAILNRTPSNQEVASWTAFLNSGVAYKELLKGFYMSAEFANLCAKAGMVSYVNKDVMNVVKASSIVSEALRWVGVGIYRNGGNNPATGTDCSGFTQYVFAQFGIELNRTAAAQAENGVRVSDPKPGDLCLWTSHAAIYIGDGRIVAAANPWQGIKISYVSQVYTPGAFLGYYRVTGVE